MSGFCDHLDAMDRDLFLAGVAIVLIAIGIINHIAQRRWSR